MERESTMSSNGSLTITNNTGQPILVTAVSATNASTILSPPDSGTLLQATTVLPNNVSASVLLSSTTAESSGIMVLFSSQMGLGSILFSIPASGSNMLTAEGSAFTFSYGTAPDDCTVTLTAAGATPPSMQWTNEYSSDLSVSFDSQGAVAIKAESSTTTTLSDTGGVITIAIPGQSLIVVTYLLFDGFFQFYGFQSEAPDQPPTLQSIATFSMSSSNALAFKAALNEPGIVIVGTIDSTPDN
jgi:hypothetical protein